MGMVMSGITLQSLKPAAFAVDRPANAVIRVMAATRRVFIEAFLQVMAVKIPHYGQIQKYLRSANKFGCALSRLFIRLPIAGLMKSPGRFL
jgi:hypothetical protein